MISSEPPAPPVPSATVDGAHLSDLRAVLGDRLALPGEPGYDTFHAWNVAVPVCAGAVIHAGSVDDVVAVMRHASAHALRVAVQCTGHGAVGGHGADVILVSTAGMDGVEIDAGRRVASVAAGVSWRQVLDAARPDGLAPICGSAPGVGVVGMLTGGGIGPLVRSYGLSADWVRAFDLVTPEGDLRHVTRENDADVFWGLCGGKDALGIVTRVELELIDLPQLTGGAIYFDGSVAAEVMRAWQQWAPTLPSHADTSIAILQLPAMPGVPDVLADRMTVAVRFASPAPIAQCDALLGRMRAIGPALIDSVARIDYADIGSIHADPVDAMPVHEEATLLASVPPEAIESLIALAGPGSDSPQAVVELRLLGGALADVDRAPAAFSHRAAGFHLLLIGVPTPETHTPIERHAAAVVDALAPSAVGGRMPNFAPGSPLRDGERRYDAETLKRLRGLSARLDPARVMVSGSTL